MYTIIDKIGQLAMALLQYIKMFSNNTNVYHGFSLRLSDHNLIQLEAFFVISNFFTISFKCIYWS